MKTPWHGAMHLAFKDAIVGEKSTPLVNKIKRSLNKKIGVTYCHKLWWVTRS